MRKILTFLALLLSFGLYTAIAEETQGLKDFFSRSGYVVEVLGGKVIIDLGKGKVSAGERFRVVREGKKLVHPVTGKEIGVLEEEVALVEVKDIKDNFSVAEVVEKKADVKKGDRIKLHYDSVCFVGSKETLFKVSSQLKGVKKGEGCEYTVRELSDGLGVEFRGEPVAFFETKKRVVVVKEGEEQPGKAIENLRVRAKMVMSLKSIPASADSCDLHGSGRDSLLILTQNKLEIYEVLKGTLVERGSYNLPAGYPVAVSCLRTERSRGAYIFVTLIINGEANTVLYKMVGDSPVIVQDNIPLFVNVLDKARAEETLYGQEFNSDDLWGRVYRLKVVADSVSRGKEVRLPRDFRIDGAFMMGELLVYVNEDRVLRVYKEDNLLLSRDDFGGSYTQAQYPQMYEDLGSLSFNPKSTYVSVEGQKFPILVRNKGSAVFRFLEVLKFKEAELYGIFNLNKKTPDIRMLKSDRLEEAVQSVVRLSDGRVIAITGRAGTIPIYNRGEVYELTFEPVY